MPNVKILQDENGGYFCRLTLADGCEIDSFPPKVYFVYRFSSNYKIAPNWELESKNLPDALAEAADRFVLPNVYVFDQCGNIWPVRINGEDIIN